MSAVKSSVVVAALVLLSTLAACGPIKPTPQQIAIMQNAAKPSSQEAAEKAVVRYFAESLKDPESARYSFLPPANGWHYPHFGWFMCGTVNAKNSYGGYVGAEAFLAYFSPNTPDLVVDGAIDSGRYSIIAGWCEQVYGR